MQCQCRAQCSDCVSVIIQLFGYGMDVLWPEALLMLLMDFYCIDLQEVCLLGHNVCSTQNLSWKFLPQAEKMMMSFDHEGDTDDEL